MRSLTVLQVGQVLATTEEIEFDCPFCNLPCVLASVDGQDDIVSHVMPTCRTYDRNTGIDYIEACILEHKKNEPN